MEKVTAKNRALRTILFKENLFLEGHHTQSMSQYQIGHSHNVSGTTL